jgi:hypothetical protein
MERERECSRPPRLLAAAALALLAAPALAQTPRTINRADYTDRLRAMWLGQCIANWTGLRTEGQRTEPPFLTDQDWGTTPPGCQFLTFTLTGDPWGADDDTDIEYVYLHLMTRAGRCGLSPYEIATGWRTHMNPAYIWVSNLRAWGLMGGGVRPPATALPASNEYWAHIDAQLTTEFFGALCPGMPEQALIYADLPIRATSAGFAAHAAQFYAVLYALALQAPPGLTPQQRVLWLVQESLEWIPATSKSADIVAFVLDDFLSNPDPDDWERTRDRVYERYQLNAAANGFVHRGWTESSVNFACGVICLLYGRGDYKRTVQIGTLSGWDSDNGTATMGGLLGLMLGYDALTAQFPGQALSDRFDIFRTRLNLPDYLPADPQAQDTFLTMAQRCAALVDTTVAAAGGTVDHANGRWILPPPPPGPRIDHNPMVRLSRRSANNQVPLLGGGVLTSSSAAANVPGPPALYGVGTPGHIANGDAHDAAGRDGEDSRGHFYSTLGSGQPPGTVQTLTVEHSTPVRVDLIRFIEGDHFTAARGFPPSQQGGWFASAGVQVRVGGIWITPAATPSEPLDPAVPFQIIDWTLATPVIATGIRISGPSGGAAGFTTCTELDAMEQPPKSPQPTGARQR